MKRAEYLALGLLLLVAAAVFGTGITWGLPSRLVDRFLFGDQPPWSGEKIAQLAGGWSDDPNRGADVDVDPLTRRSQPLLLNGTDAQRAEIIRRYRLYTYQPDEMITMRALASMQPGHGKLDPRLYQYGGLWIYPVGALLKIGSMTGLIKLRSDVTWYLDHPEEFGKFYVVARAYSAAWGLVGVAAVFWITRRLTGGALLPALFAGLCMMAMPVVINMSHEAKPHLPGAVLQLLAMMAAIKHVETHRRKWWFTAAALCGAAFGMVLSAWPIFLVLPMATLDRLRRQGETGPDAVKRIFNWLVQVCWGTLAGVVVYLAANPYIVINLFINRAVLRSNFGNSLAMYEVGRWREGLANAASLIAEGASATIAVLGIICGFLAVAWSLLRLRKPYSGPPQGGTVSSGPWRSESSLRDSILVLAAPVALILVQFAGLAAGKPGEYGRFAVLPDIMLGVVAMAAFGRVSFSWPVKLALLLLVWGLVAAQGLPYLDGFIRDRQGGSRLTLAHQLESIKTGGTAGVLAEPAPYNLPPLDLFKWQILLMPPLSQQATLSATPDLWILPDPGQALSLPRQEHYGLLLVGHQQSARISWADKRIVVAVRASLVPSDPSTSASD